MKIFIAGISGLLGLNLALQIKDRFQVSGVYLHNPVSISGVEAWPLDLTNFAGVRRALGEARPDVIVNTVALTNVDLCESDPQLAHQLNVAVAENIATVADELGCRLVHMSTDQLFDDSKTWYTETDPPAPLNSYGETKWLAEKTVLEICPHSLVVRTNFFGWGTPTRTSFSDWILGGLEKRTELTLFTDVYFTPILLNQLTDTLTLLAVSEAEGIFHVAGGERVSKFEFGMKLAEVFGLPTGGIKAISVNEFPFKARRPNEMALNTTKAVSCLKIRMPLIADGLEKLRSLGRQGWRQELIDGASVADS